MGIVRAERSMDASERERDRRYVIDDPLTAFWLRFVQPYASAIALGFGERVHQERIGPHLAEFIGNAFEAICRAHLRQWAQELLPSPASQVGEIWAGNYDIDIAAELLDGSLVFGE